MNVHYPDINFECIEGCGRCCSSSWRVFLEPGEDHQTMTDSMAAEEIRRRNYVPITVLESGKMLVTKDEQGRCLFLDQNLRCNLHKELGSLKKPRVCQQFPFQPVEVGGHYFVGMNFRCPAVQRNVGTPVAEQTEQVALYVERLAEANAPNPNFRLAVIPGVIISFAEYLEVEARVLAALDTDSPQRIWKLCLELCKGRGAASFEQADALIDEFTYHFLAMVECPYFVERRREVSENLLEQRSFYSEFYDREIAFPQALALPEWYQHEARRFLKHLVFRKQLCRGPLVARLLLLLITRQMLVFYTYVSASQRNSAAVEPQDVHYAFDRLEASPYLISEGTKPLLEVLEEIFLEHFGAAA